MADEPSATDAAAAAAAKEQEAAEAAKGKNDELDDVLKQADNPDAVKNAIDRQKEAAKAEKKRADDLAAKVKEYEDRDKTEQQKLEEAKSKAEQDAQASAAKLLRYEVAAEKGVPIKQAHRLQGTTKQELEADAAEFLKDVKAGSGGQLDGGARGSADTPQDMDSLIREAAGYR